jgi:uncharacterized membrane protein YcaP (DUF421 family)
MWFESWYRLGALLLAGVVAYTFLVLVLRVSGKRTLAKLNAFDLVVTIALGSVLATVVVSREVPVAEGVTALLLLVVLQLLVALVSTHWPSSREVITARPTALLIDGRVRHEELRRCRVTVQEVASAVRGNGGGSLTDIDVVVLETDGSLSVIADRSDATALTGVEGVGDGAAASGATGGR